MLSVDSCFCYLLMDFFGERAADIDKIDIKLNASALDVHQPQAV